MELMVGKNTVLKCSASYDRSLDIIFIWSVDSYVINFATDFEHYEQLLVSIILVLIKTFQVILNIIVMYAY